MKNFYKVDEASVRKIAERVYDNGSTVINRNDLEAMFPELKRESENERIREVAIEFVRQNKSFNYHSGISKEEVIAWLEKQDEQSLNFPKWRYKKDHAPLFRDSIILNKYGCVAKSPSGALVSDVWVLDYDELAKLPKEEIENQDEQKPTDKVESSVFKDRLLGLFQEFRWRCKDHVLTNGEILEYVDAHIHELLDIMRNPSWSKEDEQMIEGLNCCLDELEKEHGWHFIYTHNLDLELDKVRKWLKALKDRYTWKPSSVHMQYLHWIANVRLGDSVVEQEVSKYLNELYEDLKKLR